MQAHLQLTTTFAQPDEGGIVARVLEVPGAVSQGRTREEARENVLDALQTVWRRMTRAFRPLTARRST